MPTTTPHDALFKAAFSKPRHARGLLRSLVPEPLGRRIDWSTLRLESGIAVGDEDLDEQRMDLVFSICARAPKKRRVLIYVLAEHQSKVDPWMVLRLLGYLVAIWKGYRAQRPRAKKLPAILPIVVHTALPAGRRRSPSRSCSTPTRTCSTPSGPTSRASASCWTTSRRRPTPTCVAGAG
jgi:hypothetical protein